MSQIRATVIVQCKNIIIRNTNQGNTQNHAGITWECLTELNWLHLLLSLHHSQWGSKFTENYTRHSVKLLYTAIIGTQISKDLSSLQMFVGVCLVYSVVAIKCRLSCYSFSFRPVRCLFFVYWNDFISSSWYVFFFLNNSGPY